jgi:hypothetical protein
LGLIQQWVADGAPEGDTADLPAVPLWTDGWQLGPPDLVVTMPETYTLPADGKDIYRNFVIPVASSKDRHVRALEFRADTKAIHHAFLRLDRSYQCRKMDAQDKEPGFGGMETPIGAEDMGGHFMSWQPGRGPTRIPEGLAFTLPAGADLVLQFHMQPTGKPEPIRPSIGFYFTDQAATNKPMKLSLSSFAIDIPANSSNFAIEDSYLLPVDVDLLAVLPHTHYLGKRLEGYAILPDGARQDLLLIKDWDFNWQSDYRFVHPVALPKGTRLAMRYIFDNTTNNVRNPNHPPIRVKYGLQSTDEMGELWFQVLTRNKNDFVKLEDDLTRRGLDDVTYRPRTSGRWLSMTRRPAPSCRLASPFRAGTVNATATSSPTTTTARSTSASGRRHRPRTGATGSRPFPARAGTRSCDSTDRSSRGSTRPGSPATSSGPKAGSAR